MMPGWHRVLVVLLLLPLVATCGGSGGETRVPEYGTFPVPSEPTDPGGTPLGGSPPVPPELSGGVLATFDVSGETFALWIPDSPVAQTLVDAWTGTGPAVSAVCAQVEPGPGRANHNAPWSWSVREQGSLLVNGLCIGCAFAWDTPSKAEVGITNGPPYNCNDTHAGATWGMIMMQVTLIGLTDSR